MISTTTRLLSSVLIGTLLLAPALVAGQGPPRQLSDLSRPVASIESSRFSPDGQWLLFFVDSKLRDSLELYVALAAGDGADRVKLADTRGTSLAFSQDGSRIFCFRSDSALISVPITGGVATVLAELDPESFLFGLDTTANGLVLFQQRPAGGTQFDLFSVPAVGGEVSQVSHLPNSNWGIKGWSLTSDGSHIVYGAGVSRRTTVFSAPITGGPPVVISHGLQSNQQINGFGIAPDDSHVIYRVGTFANQITLHDDLYSVPLAGGAPVLVHDGYDVSAGQVHGGTWGADRFFYTADDKLFFADSNDAVTDLYLSELDGSGKTSLGSEPLIDTFWWRPQESTLIFQLGILPYSIGTRPLAGPSTLLSVHAQGHLVPGIATVTPGGGHVAYAAFVQTGQRLDAYGVNTAGDPPVRLNDILASDEDVTAIAATNSRAIFARDDRLVSVPLGGGVEIFLTDPYLDRDDFNQRDLFPDGSAVTLEARYAGPEAEELFKVPVAGGPVDRWSPPPVEVAGTVLGHVQSAGGGFVFYLADREEDEHFQLYRAPIGGAEPPNPVVGPPLDGNEHVDSVPLLAPASNTAIFRVDRAATPDELWAKTFAGALRKLFDLPATYAIVPPGHRLLYLDGGDLKEIALATGAESLIEDLATPIVDFLVSEDGSMLLLETESTTYSLPAIGGTPTDLGTVGDSSILSPDGSWALFDHDFGDLSLVSTDGQVNRPLDDFGTQISFSPDSEYLIYQDFVSTPRPLMSYEIATETELRLDEGLVRPPGFSGLQTWNVGDHDVVFTFTGSFGIGRELHRISADGTGLVSALGTPEDSLDLRDIELSDDGHFAIFEVLNPDNTSLSDLYVAATTVAGATKLLDDEDESVFLGFSPDSSLAFYQAQEPEYTAPLMAAPTGGGTPFALTPGDFGDVQPGLVFDPEGNTMTLRVKRHDARVELHALELDDLRIFIDGFETGDTSNWSSTQP